MPPNQNPAVPPPNDNQDLTPEANTNGYAQQPTDGFTQSVPVQPPSEGVQQQQPLPPTPPPPDSIAQNVPGSPLPTSSPQPFSPNPGPTPPPGDPNQASGFPPAQQPQSFNSKPKKKMLKKLLILVPIIIVIGAGVFFGSSLLSGDAKYSKLTAASNKHERDTDPKFSIDYPAEMKEVYRGPFSIEYEDRDPKEGIRARVEARSQYVGKRSMEQGKAKIKESLLAGSGEVYDSVLDSTSDEGSDKNVKFGKFTEFTNSSIKDALIVTYTQDTKLTVIGGSGGDKYVPVKGQAIMAFGEEHIYTLDITAVVKVWNKNEKIFKQILDSFKIDL